MAHENKSELSMTQSVTAQPGNFGDHNEKRTSTLNSTDVTDFYVQMISDEMMRHLEIFISLFLCGALGLFGTVSNVMNMIVFHRLGLKDSMSVSLFALAFNDFLLSFATLTARVFPIWYLFFDTPEIDVYALGFVSPAWMATFLFYSSGCATTFMSVERCICIILPFKVKQIFTKGRAIFIQSLIFVANASICLPYYCTVRLEWINMGTDSKNRTSLSRRLIVVLSHNRQTIGSILRIVDITVIPIPMFSLLLGSAIWMVIGLKRSQLLRKSMTASKTENDGEEKADSKSEYKTRRLVKVVLFIAIIYLICSLPRIYATSMNLFFPNVNQGQKETNLSLLQWLLFRMASVVNASVNIFVYLKINSNYRKKFKELFRKKA